MTKIIIAMYNPETDCVEVSLNDEIHVSFNCQKCNAYVRLDEPSDITYLDTVNSFAQIQFYT